MMYRWDVIDRIMDKIADTDNEDLAKLFNSMHTEQIEYDCQTEEYNYLE